MIYDKTCGNVRLIVREPVDFGDPVTAEIEVVPTDNNSAHGIVTNMRLEDLRDLRYLIDRALEAGR